MSVTAKNKTLLIVALACLLLGVINYLLFQPNILAFHIAGFSSGNPLLIQNETLRHLMTGYFSDIMWCSALYLVTVVVSRLIFLQLFQKLLILTLPFIVEAAQYFRIIGGTFDWYDILLYAAILLVFIICFPVLISVKYEK